MQNCRDSRLMHNAGYVPSTKFVLHDVAKEEEKVFHLCHHAKKLVTSFDKLNFLAQLLIKPFK
jgi:hypothetical protein